MTTTLDAVRKVREEHPEWPAAAVARAVGVTRQRVSQLAKEHGLTFPRGRNSNPQSRVVVDGAKPPLTSLVVGLTSELTVAADLTTRGFSVFIPLVRSAPCDLVVVGKDGTAKRIEVKPGWRQRSGSVLFKRKAPGRSDHYAVVLAGEPVLYDPPLSSEG